MTQASTHVGVVAIGRNEGERLKRCLTAAVAQAAVVVYVDSGSTDGSVAFAKSLGVEVVVLEVDSNKPFTAARARNAGHRRLISVAPDTVFVQFVDGDCELVDGYIDLAVTAFSGKEKLGVVSGRRRERDPNASIYNRLCDMEWDTPVGESRSCHGDAMFRRVAFEDAGMFDETMIAGEEPELCVRLRSKGWTLVRIDEEMTLHDAAMTKFSQWWKRAVRAGHAYAEGADKHGAPPERHNVKQVKSAVLWGSVIQFALPLAIGVCFVPPLFPFSFLFPVILLGGLGLMVAKVALYRRRKGDGWRNALVYGYFTMLGKVPLLQGIRKYGRNKRSGTQARLIEYKSEGALRG